MSTPNTHLGADRIRAIMQNARGKDIFFIGAGGIMMSSLALLTRRAGYSVSGSDRQDTELTRKLVSEGIVMFRCHAEENLGDNCGAVIYTVAISPDNPEYSRAMREGIPCISRADYLGYVMTEYKHRIGIAGMHGKSTCTSMCAQIFLSSAEKGSLPDPTVISGAEYAPMGGAYHLGDKESFIFEACEYMDSFLDFNPSVAVLLNAEMEHVDYFKSIEQIRESFRKYAALTGESGTVIYNADDENILQSVKSVEAEKLSFGLTSGADFRAVNVSGDTFPVTFDILYREKHFAHVTLPAHGKHNVYNALAAAAAATVCSVPVEDIVSGLSAFVGAKRRMEYKGKLCGADVYDDYGHHPTEILATLEGARATAKGRLICVFQPHTFSRTAALADRFEAAFAPADKVILIDTYAARETEDCGISSSRLASIIGDKAQYGGDIASSAELLKAALDVGDTAVIMGAGDIYKIYSVLGL